VARHDKTTQGLIWATLQLRKVHSRTCSSAGVSCHGVRFLSDGDKLVERYIAVF